MKITFETNIEQFKKIYLDWILSHVNTSEINNISINDLTVTVLNENSEVTIDTIIVSCEVSDEEEQELSEPSEPSEPGEE